MSAAAPARRLPGIAFEAPPPRSRRVLPRMDVAAFAGFAATGPVGVPVAVEDPAQLAELFGGDLPLAWDEARGRATHAQLVPAVRAFLRNGGRRAWVLRLAGPDAARAVVPVPGLVVDDGGELGFATVRARAVGSWADELRVSAALTSIAARLHGATPEQLELDAPVDAVVAGDLLRLRAPGVELLYVVAAIRVRRGRSAPGRVRLQVTGEDALWVASAAPTAAGTLRFLSTGGRLLTRSGEVVQSAPGHALLVLDVQAGSADAPAAGTLIRIDEQLWVRADTFAAAPDGRVQVGGTAVRTSRTPTHPWSAFEPGSAVERLGLELRAQLGDGPLRVLGELGFAPAHPRRLDLLPTDEALHTPREPLAGPPPLLWAEAARPRFPLAGPAAPGAIAYPLTLGVAPAPPVGPLRPDVHALARDGLARFSGALFLDADLREAGTRALGAQADYLRWQGPAPRRLTGVHGLLELQEPTLFAVPDAVHRPWSLVHPPATEMPEPAAPEPVPPRPLFADCEVPPAPPAPPDPEPAPAPQARYELEPQDDYDSGTLLAVHTALLRICAVRGDTLALLSGPRHWRADAAIAYAADLRTELAGDEAATLGFGALHHPWLTLGTPERGGALREVAPDGAVAGVYARRAAERGAWVAPANEPLVDVVALANPTPREQLLDLQTAQVNGVRQTPRGFVWLTADTLALDPDLRPVNVRRLLALIRRLLLLEGAALVFEPNDPAFRRGVERSVREAMNLLFALGAFAGRTADQGFRVSAGSPPNTPAGLDAGRLVVELAIAPSRPLSFLLVRLVQSGDRATRVELPG